MSENELQDTQPNPVKNEMEDTQPNTIGEAPSPAARKKFPGWLTALVLIILIVIGILGGYGSGMGKRYAAQDTQVAGQLQEQYQLGLQAMDAGKYEVARQHFEYIIQNSPEFPGIQNAYTDLLVRMAITPTLVPTLTPTVTPTPDLRSVDEIYNNVVALISAPNEDLCAYDWDGIINKLDSLRKADSTYHAAEVDGMYYIALRSRGVCKIYPQTYQPNAYCEDLNINLNGGIYDLTLAENFAPLDSKADSMRTWARMYIAGASFWDQDWAQAKNFFTQVMNALPNLSDSSCVSATERWRQASINYGLQLLNSGDYCGAEAQFADAMSIQTSKNDPYVATATSVQGKCNGSNSSKSNKNDRTPTPAATEAVTEVPTQEAPTEAPTEPPVAPTDEPPAP
jgi:hypothetical protein